MSERQIVKKTKKMSDDVICFLKDVDERCMCMQNHLFPLSFQNREIEKYPERRPNQLEGMLWNEIESSTKCLYTGRYIQGGI